MFNHSGAVDQDLSGWDITEVTDFFAAFTSDYSKWSPANYDRTLIGWVALAEQYPEDFSALIPSIAVSRRTTAFYSSEGAEARALLETKG
jgi:hypothetical protein